MNLPRLNPSEQACIRRICEGEWTGTYLPELLQHRLIHAFRNFDQSLWPAPDTVAALDALGRKARQETELWTEEEARLCRHFKHSGVPMLLAKGALLAHADYAAPGDRVRTDIDMVVSPESVPQTFEVLDAAGYGPAQVVHGGAPTRQRAWLLLEDPSFCIDVHWRLNDHPALRQILDFKQILDDSRPLLRLDSEARGLSRRHALMHACMHYFGHNRGTFRPLIWLLDIDLLWKGMNESERAATIEAARGAGILSLVAAGLALSHQAWRTPVQGSCLEGWLVESRHERSAWLIQPFRSRTRDLVFALRCEPDMSRRWQHAKAVFLPPREHLQRKYPDGSKWGYAGLILRRLFDARHRP